jgi:hypothetical protein
MKMGTHFVRWHASADDNDFTKAKNSVNGVLLCLPESTFSSLGPIAGILHSLSVCENIPLRFVVEC